jgi:hypothetical protein
VTGTERIVAGKAPILGIIKVLPQEYANLTAVGIDVVLDGAHTSDIIEQLSVELQNETSDDVVALRGMHRWLPCWNPLRTDDTSGSRLRHGGTYLITGGLGGIGLALAVYLTETWQAQIGLVARTLRPDRVLRVRELQATGASIVVVQADVADPAQVRNAVDRIETAFGPVHGVIHAAGMPAIGMMQWKTARAVAGVFAPKVRGALALAEAFGRRKLDFMVLFGSVTSATGGGPGQADYCAANAFLDAWARSEGRAHNAISVSWCEWLWDAWSEGLAGFPEDMRSYLVANRKAYGLSFEEGCNAVVRVLSSHQPHVFVATQDLDTMVERSRAAPVTANSQQIENRQSSRALYARPMLATSYVEPQPGLESDIAAVWREMIGIDAVGRHDNFFELGGNSLLGVALIARLRQALKLNKLPAHLLYEAPTVGALAQFVDTGSVTTHDLDAPRVDYREEMLELFRQRARSGEAL